MLERVVGPEREESRESAVDDLPAERLVPPPAAVQSSDVSELITPVHEVVEPAPAAAPQTPPPAALPVISIVPRPHQPAPEPDPFAPQPVVLEELPPFGAPRDPFANDPFAAEPAPAPAAPAAPGRIVIRITPRTGPVGEPQAIGTPVTEPGPVAIGTPVTDGVAIGTPVTDGAIGTPVTDPGPAPLAVAPVRASRRVGRVEVHAQARPAPTGAAGMRGRVREALRCPFCHDGVDRGGGVACARRRCGAMYHRACWDEVVTHYGGCAAMGCGSNHAVGVGRFAFSWRVLRLALAAFLFPPRVIRALEQAGDAVDVAAIRRALEARADATDDALWGRRGRAVTGAWGSLWGFTQLAVVIGTMVATFAITVAFYGTLAKAAAASLVVPIVAGVLATIALYNTTRGMALALYVAQSILEGEVAALGRAGASGWLGVMRQGGKKKPT